MPGFAGRTGRLISGRGQPQAMAMNKLRAVDGGSTLDVYVTSTLRRIDPATQTCSGKALGKAGHLRVQGVQKVGIPIRGRAYRPPARTSLSSGSRSLHADLSRTLVSI